MASARASGVRVTPTFFINGRRYDGPWDDGSLSEAMLGSLGHRVHSAAVDFASWAPSTGVLLLLMSILAVADRQLAARARGFAAFWEAPFGLEFGDARFRMSLAHWVNDGLLTIFFLVVGPRDQARVHGRPARQPALRGVPDRRGARRHGGAGGAVRARRSPPGAWSHGWGVPMATDTAFAVALIVMLGRRVPVELRVFLTAASIVDDIGAIVVVALFYSGALHWALSRGRGSASSCCSRCSTARACTARCPTRCSGVALWACVHAGGLHATLAGVLLALFIPTRPPPNLARADGAGGRDAERRDRARPRRAAPRSVGAGAARARRDPRPARVARRPHAARDRAVVELSSCCRSSRWPTPACRCRSPVLARARGAHRRDRARPRRRQAGRASCSRRRSRCGPASRSSPRATRGGSSLGAGALAGIGFTMSLFIAGQALPTRRRFRGGEDRGLRRVDRVGVPRRGAAVEAARSRRRPGRRRARDALRAHTRSERCAKLGDVLAEERP